MPGPSCLPDATGLGIKAQHYGDLLDVVGTGRPGIPGWVEVHPQNYLGAGGPPHRWLTRIRQELPVSFHSVGLSLGSADGVDPDALERLAALVGRYEPAVVSDHLSWSRLGSVAVPDLLPLPMVPAVLDHLVGQVAKVQERLGRTILVENPSRYVAFAGDEIPEWAFLDALCERSGCGLLLDVNNVVVTSVNLGTSADELIGRVGARHIGEVHLAGHTVERHEAFDLCIDDHGSPVGDEALRRFGELIDRVGPRPTLVEWDTDVPAFEVLTREVARVQAVLERTTRSPLDVAC